MNPYQKPLLTRIQEFATLKPDDRIVFIEAKVSDKLTPVQRGWLDTLIRKGWNLRVTFGGEIRINKSVLHAA